MGSKNKLKRFNQNLTFKNVIQPTREELVEKKFALKGNWNKDFFKNDNPIVLELGCGKGEYTVYLAQEHPSKNFIGIDLKGARFWAGAKESLELELTNVAFIRAQIELVTDLFAENEIDEIWITFPDPQLKKRKGAKRLTHPDFLKRYNNILKKDGIIHLKTDSQFLHGFTLGVITGENHILEDSTHDLYTSPVEREHMEIKTHYEQIYLNKGLPITYLRFRLK